MTQKARTLTTWLKDLSCTKVSDLDAEVGIEEKVFWF